MLPSLLLAFMHYVSFTQSYVTLPYRIILWVFTVIFGISLAVLPFKQTRYAFQIIFLVSSGSFVTLGFFLASSDTLNTATIFFIVTLSGLTGKMLLMRIFSTNTRTDRTSSLDYILSSSKTKQRIDEMFIFSSHVYCCEFILSNVDENLPLNSRQK